MEPAAALPAKTVPPFASAVEPSCSAAATARRSFLHRLCFTAEDHLDLSWLLVVINQIMAIGGTWRELTATDLAGRPSPWWWAYLAASQLAVLIAAVPIAKARLLAQSRALAAAHHAIGAAAQFTPNEWADGVEPGVI